jgi:hypothetical protein
MSYMQMAEEKKVKPLPLLRRRTERETLGETGQSVYRTSEERFSHYDL